MLRPILCAVAACLLAGPAASEPLAAVPASYAPVLPDVRPAPRAIQAAEPGDAGLSRWIAAFYPRAQRAGITRATLDAAFAGVRYDAEVVRRDRNQSEFSKTVWDYLGTAVSAARIRNGRAALNRHAVLLTSIEAHLGVDKEIVTAIWGLESAYGATKGGRDVIGSMATLAYDGRRGDFFEAELVAALRIIQDGDISPRAMKGSWAGAMGHTQFMPSSYLEHAVDVTRDGRRDIWGEDPSDALASTAVYLRANGWTPGQPWGVEVRLPQGFDFDQATRDIARLPSAWARLGVRDMEGRAVPDHGRASILLPAGAKGAAFMIFDNFEVLESYNTADAYVIGVGHLADRLKGGAPIRGGWPTGDRALTLPERLELQRLLTAGGFRPGAVDGKMGPLTIDAVRRYQRSQGLVPDGYANPALLARMRR